MKEQAFRFIRITLMTLVPAALVYGSAISNQYSVPIVGVIAASLAVLWRQYKPLDNTSQLWRFVRVAAFVIVPQAIAQHFSSGDPALVAFMAAVSGTLETAWRATFPTDEVNTHDN